MKAGLRSCLVLLGGCSVGVRPTPEHAEYLRLAQAALGSGEVRLERDLHFGSDARSLVPPYRISLSGFGGIHRRLVPPLVQPGSGEWSYQAPYETVEQPPRVKTFVWTSASQVALLVSLDVVAVTPDMKGRLLEGLTSSFSSWQWKPEAVVVTASHTHSGPAGLSRDPLFEALAGDLFSRRYSAFVEKATLASVGHALTHREPLLGISSKRASLPGFNATRVKDLAAEADATYVSFETSSSRNCLVNFAVHSTILGQKERRLSADLAGHIEAGLEAAGHGHCIFLPGLLANATPRLDRRTMTGYAEEFSREILISPEIRNSGGIALRQKRVVLPKPRFNFEACNAAWAAPFTGMNVLEARPGETTVSLLRLGDLPLVFLPVEAGSDFREAVGESALSPWTPFISVAQDYQGYLVKKNHYEQVSLEACSTLYPPELHGLLARKARELLAEVQ